MKALVYKAGGESFNYIWAMLKKTFGKRLTPYQCEMLGRVDGKQVATSRK